ncbi:D-arabinono-1,4-lactone oxidase [Jiangella asiatica]|uniref:FAD-binding protein n=1 Tax=Jiangella asiatica TaxID=2530372 RepID=A0A4R5DHC5_9ACTN|nr:D-arabinono-1,4-lactone oxidase [Jiangella asiatica]TDE10155.1 FAD-binding protein [Jiangella asiatica]
MSAPGTNWAGNVAYGARRVHTPLSVSQVRELVAGSPRIRALGSRHSFNEVADTEGDLLSLAGLPPEVVVDAEAGTVTVAAGLRYGDLCLPLHEQGWALHNLGSLPHISVAGACATATHGSGDGNANLAAAVAALQLVTADGDLVTLRRGDDDFAGAVVGLGAVGVVVSLTLDIVPAFDIRQEVYEGLARETVEKRFDEIFATAYSVSVFTDWAAPTMLAWVKRRVDEPDDWAPDQGWMGARPADGPRHPVPGMPATYCTPQLGVPGPSYDRLPHFRLDFTPSSGEELQSEYLVPRVHGVDALRALDRIRGRIAPVLQISEIRTVAADDLWLSAAYGGDVVGFHFTWVRDAAAVLPVLPLIEQQLAPFDARPHWGKLFTVDPERLPELYPRLADFRELRRRYDPKNTFGNAFTDRYLG